MEYVEAHDIVISKARTSDITIMEGMLIFLQSTIIPLLIVALYHKQTLSPRGFSTLICVIIGAVLASQVIYIKLYTVVWTEYKKQKEK